MQSIGIEPGVTVSARTLSVSARTPTVTARTLSVQFPRGQMEDAS
jgi:hypothetical protein